MMAAAKEVSVDSAVAASLPEPDRTLKVDKELRSLRSLIPTGFGKSLIKLKLLPTGPSGSKKSDWSLLNVSDRRFIQFIQLVF